MQILKEMAGQHPLLEIGEQIKLKTYTSHNFMGFFVNDEAATKLKRMAMQFVQKVSSSGNVDENYLTMLTRVEILHHNATRSSLFNYQIKYFSGICGATCEISSFNIGIPVPSKSV